MRTSVRLSISTLICLIFSIILGYQYQSTFNCYLLLFLWIMLTMMNIYGAFLISQINTAQVLNKRIKTNIENMLFKLLNNMSIFYLLSSIFLFILYWVKTISVFGYVFRYDYFTLSFIIYSMIYNTYNSVKITEFNTDLENKIKEEQLNN